MAPNRQRARKPSVLHGAMLSADHYSVLLVAPKKLRKMTRNDIHDPTTHRAGHPADSAQERLATQPRRPAPPHHLADAQRAENTRRRASCGKEPSQSLM